MPCYDPRSHDGSIYKEEIDKLTRLLCEAGKHVRRNEISQELTDWIVAHAQSDVERKKREAQNE